MWKFKIVLLGVGDGGACGKIMVDIYGLKYWREVRGRWLISCIEVKWRWCIRKIIGSMIIGNIGREKVI